MAFDLSVERTEEGGLVRIKNRAGHRIPGLIGREIEFEAEVLDGDGDVVVRGHVEIDKRRYLPVGGETQIELHKAGVEVRIRGTHDAPRADDPILFLDGRLPFPKE